MEKDLIIYDGIAKAAARVFDNVVCPAGEYSAKDLVKYLGTRYYFEIEYNEKHVKQNEIITVSFDGSKCSFPVDRVFDICARFETALSIPSARRVKFVRAAETRPVAVAFDVPAAAKDIIKAIPAKGDNLRPALNYVCVDTRRRCLAAVNMNVLSVVSVPDMYVSPDAKETYLIDPAVLKTGKGTLFVDEENAVNGTQTRPNGKDHVFPVWDKILPAVSDAQRINLAPETWKQLKKEITAAAKFSDNAKTLVQISGREDSDKIKVTYLRIFETDKNETKRETFVNLPQACPFDFSVQINGKQFAAVPAANSMYIFRDKNVKTAVCFAAVGAVSYLPNLDVYSDVNTAAVPVFSEDAPGAAQKLLSVAAFPEIGSANSPAAAALIETAAAADSAPAVSEDAQPGPAVVSFEFDETPAAVPEEAQETTAAADSEKVLPVDEETPAAAFEDAQPVPVSADRWETEYFEAAAETGPGVPVPVLPAGMDAVLYSNICRYLKIYFDEETALTRAAYNYIILHGVKIIFGEIYLHDEKIGKVKKEFLDGICTNAAPAFDILETPQDEETPAAADSVPAVPEDAQPGPAANTLPVPCFTENLHAVYLDGVLHRVYYSQLLADNELFNLLFAGRDVYPYTFPANETAPETERAAVLIACKRAGVSVPEDAQAVPVDEETPAVLIAANFARRARRVWQTAAAVLFLIVCAAAPVFVPEDAPDAPAAVLFADSLTAAPVSVPEDAQPAPAVLFADSLTAAPADSVPAVAKKQPQTRRKRARRRADSVPADSVPAAALFADSLTAAPADSVPADSVPAAALFADSLTAAPADSLAADSVPAAVLFADSLTAAPVDSLAADSVPADSVPAAVLFADSLTAAPVDSLAADSVPAVPEDAQPVPAVDEETTAPADSLDADSVPAVPEDAQAGPAVDEETAAPADSVPAANGNSPAQPVPAVVPVAAVSGCPAALFAYVIGCKYIH